jgi:hypothetical protein
MSTGPKQTLHTLQHPSLLALRNALSMAESVAPARPPYIDTNEQLALQLIARMQAHYKTSLPILDLRDIPASYVYRRQLQEMAGAHAR